MKTFLKKGIVNPEVAPGSGSYPRQAIGKEYLTQAVMEKTRKKIMPLVFSLWLFMSLFSPAPFVISLEHNGQSGMISAAGGGLGRTTFSELSSSVFNAGSGAAMNLVLDNPVLKTEFSGSAPWTMDSRILRCGTESAVSGLIRDNEFSTLETVIEYKYPITLKFYWKVSSEAHYDFLRFYVDGVEKCKISGVVEWRQYSLPIPPGRHMLKWSYSKDSSGSGGADRGWLDKVDISEARSSAHPISEALDSPGVTFSLGGDRPFEVTHCDFFYDSDSIVVPAALYHNEESVLQTTVSGSSVVKFAWKVSSEKDADVFSFFIDGKEIKRISGESAWIQESFAVSSAEHVLRWVFKKDYSSGGGSDRGWIDRVEVL